jgi:hypothetical protein
MAAASPSACAIRTAIPSSRQPSPTAKLSILTATAGPGSAARRPGRPRRADQTETEVLMAWSCPSWACVTAHRFKGCPHAVAHGPGSACLSGGMVEPRARSPCPSPRCCRTPDSRLSRSVCMRPCTRSVAILSRTRVSQTPGSGLAAAAYGDGARAAVWITATSCPVARSAAGEAPHAGGADGIRAWSTCCTAS